MVYWRGAVIALMGSQSIAGGICKPTDTVQQCIGKQTTIQIYENNKIDDITTDSVDAVSRKMSTIPTGISLSSLANTVTDTLPFLSASSTVGDNLQNQPDSVIAIAPRLFTDEQAKAGNDLFQLEFVSSPELLPVFSEFLKENESESKISELESTLSEADDLLFKWTHVVDGKYFSRDINDYRSLVKSSIAVAFQRTYKDNADNRERILKQRKLASDLTSLGKQDNACKGIDPGTKYDSVDNNCVPMLDRLIRDHAAVNVERHQAESSALDEMGVGHFAGLVANNAQLKFGVYHHAKDALVGADVTAAKVGFEFSTRSLTWFLLKNRALCSAEKTKSDGYDACVRAFSEYTENRTTSFSQGGVRFAFEAEYARLQAERVTLPLATDVIPPEETNDGPVTAVLQQAGLVDDDNGGAPVLSRDVHLPEVERLAVDIGVGWIFMPPTVKNGISQSARLDAYGKYRKFSSNVIYGEAWSAGLVLSMQVGSVSFPFYIVHEGKSEFDALGLNLQDTTVGLGVSYKLFE